MFFTKLCLGCAAILAIVAAAILLLGGDLFVSGRVGFGAVMFSAVATLAAHKEA